MRIGYARVSTEDQRLDLQIKALNSAHCDKIISDKGVSGKSFERPGLDEAITLLKTGDTLVVWRLDRLGRSLVQLVHLVDKLGGRGIHLHSLSENIDTETSGGRLVFHMIAALAEFERALISERTRAGMAAARDKGTRLGRPPLLTQSQVEQARQAIQIQGEALSMVAQRYKVTPRTLQRMLKKDSKIAA